MHIIDGKALAQQIRTQIAEEVKTLTREHNIVPGLAVILVGDDPASHAYVRMRSSAPSR